MRSCRIRRAARCISFRPRRWRRISSPSCRALCETLAAQCERADRRLHLRRRHAAGCAADDSRARPSRAQQSRHGALGHPAAPSAVGEALREPALRRHRRAARLSRRVRQPSVQRAAPAAPDLPALRIRSRLPLLVGDDCQPARAGRAARPSSRSSSSIESGAPRGEKFFVFVNPPVVNHQLGIRRSYLSETRRIAAEFLKRNLQLIVFAQSRLVDRDPDDLPEGRLRGVPGAPGADPRISRRLPAESPPRDREGAARGQRCAPSCRPTRSSSASTSARSTSR